ncbi:MAG: ornithine carbamoyltransferase [Methanobacterium formicicum]|jgi:ornithine carbamoyltransferase|uniref:Ornithine carbamoyltransferase n=1 Tax=Methanobacterium formicicum TaxID=2162 RepID=A0A843AP81_METFO|nr:ornithine carbamoyltransferase [Methanobacterium formicicum]MBF4474960.1 ornithine carbamoyltransferase [Methanobacterium formicicum]MDD4809698.1 ornithine carbamoyltransferase [Methanobacterium formicicum]MDG3547031.1 ornithine carbamoyltransferase [Methanobacterium formicicum]
MKHLLSALDARDHLEKILEDAEKFKSGKGPEAPLKGKSLAMVFEKSSTRTRISFEVGMYQLGGHPLYLSASDLQLGRGEIIPDTARAMSRYVDGIMIRAREHDDVLQFAQYADIPVINGLTNLEHPCQAFTDIFTIRERKNTLDLKMTFLGDGNNVCNSLLLATAMVGMDFTVACPPNYQPDSIILKEARKIAQQSGSTINITDDVAAAVKDADVLYTDVWVSMGDEAEEAQRIRDMQYYQVNQNLVGMAAPDAMVLHCLPAIRGQEITEEVLNGPQSAVWDEAENRLHVQKAILYHLLKD